jgi:hypothetical protein
MRALRLARVAAEAELLLLRRRVRRTVIRVIYAVSGAFFTFAALTFAHVALFLAIQRNLGPTTSALIVLGGDLLIALICILVASVSSPDQIEREALQVRQQAQQQLEETLAAATLAAPAARLLGRPRALGAALALVLPSVVARLRR